MKKVKQVVITFDDGSTETHDASDCGIYRHYPNHVEGRPGYIEASWISHDIHWRSSLIERNKQPKATTETKEQT